MMLGHNRAQPRDWELVVGNYNFGDDGGSQGAFTIFTVTGDVMVKLPPAICDVALTSGGVPTIELGVSGNTAALIAQIANATALIANELWHDGTPTTTLEQIDIDGSKVFVIANGQDIIMTLGGADLTAGDIDFPILWKPLSVGASLVAA